ncbi:MAG: hypothetical protein H6634_09935 [Anaerolineales bacterium]|nr:hypothetical protein [Anaerolineales bacterium]
MTVLSKEKFQLFWESDWILRTLVIYHYLFWNGDRATPDNYEQLRRFLVKYSVAHTKSELGDILRIYFNHGILLTLDKIDPETGLINPDAFGLIRDIINDEYGLERFITPGYRCRDLLWDVINHPATLESKLASNFEALFRETFGFSTELFSVGQGKAKHDILRLTWQQGENQFAWWLHFHQGIYLKREDAVAEGLITSSVMNVHLLASNNIQFAHQYATICGLEFGSASIDAIEHVNESFGFGEEFSLILIISLFRVLAWGESHLKSKKNDMAASFSEFFENQDNPLSARKGIVNILSKIKPRKNS